VVSLDTLYRNQGHKASDEPRRTIRALIRDMEEEIK
jgi:hypothetical protein